MEHYIDQTEHFVNILEKKSLRYIGTALCIVGKN